VTVDFIYTTVVCCIKNYDLCLKDCFSNKFGKLREFSTVNYMVAFCSLAAFQKAAVDFRKPAMYVKNLAWILVVLCCHLHGLVYSFHWVLGSRQQHFALGRNCPTCLNF